jgi:hypothetical protein
MAERGIVNFGLASRNPSGEIMNWTADGIKPD